MWRLMEISVAPTFVDIRIDGFVLNVFSVVSVEVASKHTCVAVVIFIMITQHN